MSEIAVLRVFTGLILFVIGIGFFTEEDVPRAQHLVGYMISLSGVVLAFACTFLVGQ